MTDPGPLGPGQDEVVGEYEIKLDKRGTRRLHIAGRGGFPLTMKEGETAAEALTRHEAVSAANRQRKGQTQRKGRPRAQPDTVTSSPGLAENIARKIQGIPEAGPGHQDPPPSEQRQPKTPDTPKTKPSTKELQGMLEELLVAPSVYFGWPTPDPDPANAIELPGGRRIPGTKPRCEYCRNHFLTAGPQAAAELAKLSEDNDALRRLLERFYAAWGAITFGSVLAGYVAKPALHHLAPAPVMYAAAPLVDPQMPPRPPKMPKPPSRVRHSRHARRSPAASASRRPPGPPGPTPPGGPPPSPQSSPFGG